MTTLDAAIAELVRARIACGPDASAEDIAAYLAIQIAHLRPAVSRGFTQGRDRAPRQAPGEKLNPTNEAAT